MVWKQPHVEEPGQSYPELVHIFTGPHFELLQPCPVGHLLRQAPQLNLSLVRSVEQGAVAVSVVVMVLDIVVVVVVVVLAVVTTVWVFVKVIVVVTVAVADWEMVGVELPRGKRF